VGGGDDGCRIVVDGETLPTTTEKKKKKGGSSKKQQQLSTGDGGGRKNYRIQMVGNTTTSSSNNNNNNNGGDGGEHIEAASYPFPTNVNGNPVRFTPVQVKAIQSGLSPGLTLIVGPPGTGKTDVAVQIIANIYHSFPTQQRTILVTHSNAALNDLFEKVMARGDVDERYMLRLGSGERDLQCENTESDFDCSKLGRVSHILARRTALLEKVQCLSKAGH